MNRLARYQVYCALESSNGATRYRRKRLPQDGRIALKVANRPVDIRVSTLPSGHGERVVMRILDKQAGRLDLLHLGMDDAIRKRLSVMIEKPHGIILVTGPTGSGKTTPSINIVGSKRLKTEYPNG